MDGDGMENNGEQWSNYYKVQSTGLRDFFVILDFNFFFFSWYIPVGM